MFSLSATSEKRAIFCLISSLYLKEYRKNTQVSCARVSQGLRWTATCVSIVAVVFFVLLSFLFFIHWFLSLHLSCAVWLVFKFFNFLHYIKILKIANHRQPATWHWGYELRPRIDHVRNNPAQEQRRNITINLSFFLSFSPFISVPLFFKSNLPFFLPYILTFHFKSTYHWIFLLTLLIINSLIKRSKV